MTAVSGHTNDMLERIERCERELQALRGYTKALESGLHAVILFSPEPVRLLGLWEGVCKAYSESDASVESRLHHLALRQAMDTIGDHIRHAVSTQRKWHN